MESKPVISYSQLGVWNKCRYHWWLGYDQGWTRKENAEYFVKGTEVHNVLAAYYEALKNGASLGDDTELKIWMNKSLERDLSFEVVNNLGWLLSRYIKDFSVFEDKKLEIIEVEKELAIDLETPKGREFTLHGIVDLLVKVNGRYWLWDHKTAGNASFWSDTEILMDAQMPTYQAILNRHGYNIFGINFNFINTYPYKKRDEVSPEKLFKRVNTYRTEVELESLLHEFGAAVDDMIDNQNNIRRSLSKDCARCVFQDPCLLSMKGIPINDVIQSGFRQKGQEAVEVVPESDSYSTVF